MRFSSTPFCPTPQGRGHRHRRHALALAAAAMLAAPAAQALDIFTGNTPVFFGTWFNGSFTERHEFQFALDWQGWCNARPGADCTSHRYWNVAGNWSNGVWPSLSSGVSIPAGNTVRVGTFLSLYLGIIGGTALAGTLDAKGRVELLGQLSVGNAFFADLYNLPQNVLGVTGALITSGVSTISLLSSGTGRFEGVGGTTVVQAFTPGDASLGKFSPTIGGGHTLQFSGSSLNTPMAVVLEPTARFVNSGTLAMGGEVRLEGNATFPNLPVFVNTGSLRGSGAVSGVKFENQGQVQVGDGQALSLANWGEHTGSFTGGLGSTLSFIGIGSAGHRFAPGSGVISSGSVRFDAGNHLVQGDFNVNSVTTVANSVGFEGSRPVIGSLTLNGSGNVGLRNAGGATIGDLVINNDSARVDVDTGAPLDLQRLRLVRGSFNVRAPVNIAGSVEWSSGYFIGTQPLTVAVDWQLLAGDRVFGANVINSGNLSWEGGRFIGWSGSFTHQAGRQFDIWGDFNSAGGGGKLVNSGTVTKQSGTGRSELAMGFDNIGGTVRALSGTLALVGGGTHTDATFAANAAAAIELAGGTTFGGQISTSGRLNVTGGDFTLLGGTSYLHAAGQRFDVAHVRINPGAHLSVVDALVTTGSLTNLGSFMPSSHVQIGGDFVQQGSFGLNPGKNLVVLGTFSNPRPLTVSDALFRADTLVNASTLNITGNANFWVNTLDNRGTLVLGPANGASWVTASIGGVGNSSNSGTLRVDGAQVSVSSRDLQNTGVIANEGEWLAYDNFAHAAGSRFTNSGSLSLDGTTTVSGAASIQNSGTITLQNGALNILPGGEVSGAGSFLQQAGVTRVNGRLQADGGITIASGVLKGTGTVEGLVTIGPGGLWRPGNSPGTMTVLGDADLRGTLEIEIATPAVLDRLVGLNNFTARDGAAINFVFAPGYTGGAVDIESISWLSAVNTNFQGNVTLGVSGLPSHWSAALSPDGRQIQLSNGLAVQVPLRGNHAIPVGGVQFNALSNYWNGDSPWLDRLDNAGYFHNRADATTVGVLLNNETGATLVNRGGLYAVTLNNAGQLNNRSGGSLAVEGELTNSGTLVNEGSLQVVNFTNNEGAVLEQRGSMDLGGHQFTNRGRLLVTGTTTYASRQTFYNDGDLTIEAGGSITGGPDSTFWHGVNSQTQSELRVDGLLAASDILVFGRVSGNGQIQGRLRNYATIAPGNSIGLLTVQGDLVNYGGLELEIASAISFDRLVVTGDVTSPLGATMYLLGSYRPTLGDSFNFLSVGGTLDSGNPLFWQVLRLVDPDDATSGWTPWADAGGIYDANVPGDWRAEFSSQGQLRITAVPEPSTWAMLCSGLLVAGFLVNRRRPG